MKPNAKVPKKAARFGMSDTDGEKPSWRDAKPDTLSRTVSVADAAGIALMFGRTRDRGAFSIRIYDPTEPYTIYIRPSEDINYVLDNLAEHIIANYPDNF